MPSRRIFARPEDFPRTSLLALFIIWKALLLVVTAFSPGSGYDTSTTLLDPGRTLSRDHHTGSLQPQTFIERFLLKLCRWDAIYFTVIAHRGYTYEQEWAFGWGYTRLLSLLARSLSVHWHTLYTLIAIGALVSHLSHLLSAFVLYHLVKTISPKPHADRLAFLAASFHIISPAGIFLSAPYGESLFSLLNFLGMLLYCESDALATSEILRSFRGTIYLLGAGSCFGLATTVRSNGLLSGSIFAYDVVAAMPRLPHVSSSPAELQRLAVTAVAGCLVAAGMIYPQWVAYEEYCLQPSTESRRPWCDKLLPSIYSWVQANYWNVGFLRYWTISNLPLFLIASPMLYIMLTSSLWAVRLYTTAPNAGKASNASYSSKKKAFSPSEQETSFYHHLCRLALPQLLVTIIAITTSHVQIITRISSGYPVLYIWLADSLIQDPRTKSSKRRKVPIEWIIRWMVMYGIIQSGLFASFLPPA